MLNLISFQTSDTGPVYVAEVLVNMTKESAKSRNTAVVKPSPTGILGEMQVLFKTNAYEVWFSK